MGAESVELGRGHLVVRTIVALGYLLVAAGYLIYGLGRDEVSPASVVAASGVLAIGLAPAALRRYRDRRVFFVFHGGGFLIAVASILDVVMSAEEGYVVFPGVDVALGITAGAGVLISLVGVVLEMVGRVEVVWAWQPFHAS